MPAKILYTYDHTFKDLKSFSSSLPPHKIEETISAYFQSIGVEPVIHKTKFKMIIKFEEENQIEILVKLSKVNE